MSEATSASREMAVVRRLRDGDGLAGATNTLG